MPPPHQAGQGRLCGQHIVVSIPNVTHEKLILSLQFVTGDAKSQDTLCGRYGSHHSTNSQLINFRCCAIQTVHITIVYVNISHWQLILLKWCHPLRQGVGQEE
eukprot:scaffold210106_cov35-Attheya_sp.AAC.1